MILLVAATRPNFMKIAPIYRALRARDVPVRLLHTGQHFDKDMSEVFFRDLGLPEPDLRLSSGGGSHARQTADVLVGVEQDLVENRPAAVLVVGDVTSTLAAALAASKLGVPVVHVEAGLRSRDWTMPEEINRVLTDQLSDLLLTSSAEATPNLLAEGIPANRITFVGNVMIDSLHQALAQATPVLERLGLTPRQYALATLHRPANVDSAGALTKTLDVIAEISGTMPVVFPLHPRTAAKAALFGLDDRLRKLPGVVITEPLGQRDFATLMSQAKLVATDSGGVQEETTALAIPCLTLREGTERPITVTEGTAVIVGLDLERVRQAVAAVAAGTHKRGQIPPGWDGHAAERVAEAVVQLLRGSPAPKTAGPRA